MQENDTSVGFDNSGGIVVKNRAYRRKRHNVSELEGLSKNYFTKKQTKIRRRNGKTTKIRKKSGK